MLVGLASEGGVQSTVGDPGPGGGGIAQADLAPGSGPQAEAGPRGAPCGHVDGGQGVRGAVPMQRKGGRRESGQEEKAGLVAAPSVQLT